MKFTKLLMLAVILLCSSQNALAYRGLYGHEHSLDKPIIADEALEIAARILVKLAEKGIVPMSWSHIKPVRAEQKYFNEKSEWMITFRNPNVRIASRQQIYVFVSPVGDYIAANYTGR